LNGVTPIAAYSAQVEAVCDHLRVLAATTGEPVDWGAAYDELGRIIEGLQTWRAVLAFPGDQHAAIFTQAEPRLRALAAQLRAVLQPEGPVE
jgi:hypothetical protein